MLKKAYVKVVSVHGLVVQRDRHSDADVRFPLDGGWGDDEVVGVVAHQVHLEHAVQTLRESEEAIRKGCRRSGGGARLEQQRVLESDVSNLALQGSGGTG